MKKALFFLTLAATLLACTNSEKNTKSDTEKANEIYKAYFDEMVDMMPLFQTQLGIKKDYDKWNDLSDEAQIDVVRLREKYFQKLRDSVDYEELDNMARLAYDNFEMMNRDVEEDIKYRHYSYPVNQMFGWQSTVITTLTNSHRIDSAKDARDYISRVEGVQPLFEQLIKNLEKREELGIVLPKHLNPLVVNVCENLLSGITESSAKDHLLYQDFNVKIEKLNLAEEESKELLNDLERALLQHFQPAYASLINFLKAQETRATPDQGAWKFPEGDAYYQYILSRENTVAISPEEVYQLGLSEVERIHTEVLLIMEKVGFEGSLQDFLRFMRDSDQFYLATNEENKAMILDSINALVEIVNTRIDDFFNVKPKAEMNVKAVEPYREKSAGYAFYQRPALDGSRPGIYYINLYDLKSVPFFELEALTYHEAIPGHHFNLTIAQELTGIPDFMKHQRNTAHSEGWGLYCEYLAKEMGMYENPYADFGRLNLELFRACRLVVDAGIHHQKWDREKAVQYYLDNTSSSRLTCESMVDRHTVMPGQATTYKVGMLKILELREKAEKALGEQYDIRDFHDVILTNGLLPLEIVEKLVDDYIAKKGGV